MFILADLVSALTIVLHHKDEETSAKHLPTDTGFFFGSIDYDEYYYDSCQETLEVINDLLKNEQDGDLWYRASW